VEEIESQLIENEEWEASA
jgi:hypothetical protein